MTHSDKNVVDYVTIPASSDGISWSTTTTSGSDFAFGIAKMLVEKGRVKCKTVESFIKLVEEIRVAN